VCEAQWFCGNPWTDAKHRQEESGDPLTHSLGFTLGRALRGFRVVLGNRFTIDDCTSYGSRFSLGLCWVRRGKETGSGRPRALENGAGARRIDRLPGGMLSVQWR
jgi:hypothetical protein